MRRIELSLFRSIRFALALVAAVLLWLVPLTAMAPSPATAQPSSVTGTPSLENTPLDLVVLVDESGSESPADIKHETEAAGTLAQAPLNPRSRVTVFGFGGADGAAPNQNPIDAVCQPTVVNSKPNLEYLATCVNKLHARTQLHGWSTDYVAALTQAMSVLNPSTPTGQQSPSGALKVIIMMTDGGLDETGNPAYPQPNWQTAARNAVSLELSAAQQAGVEVWPLGFGSIDPSDQNYLFSLATGGGQKACDSRSASKPHGIIAQNSQAALAALNELFAAATCSGTSSGGSVTVPPGGSRTLSVNIPPIASSGAISVNKGNPAIQVKFLAPGGAAVSGGTTVKGSTFQISGEDSAVEVLHITNPASGTWQVQLTAPPGIQSQLVSVTAFWQGTALVSLFPSPPAAKPGQKVTVTLSLVGQKGPITDPSMLSGIAVQVTASGDGLTGPTSVPLTPTTVSGRAGDYTGSFNAPGASGTVSLTGTASGYGLYATSVHTSVGVGNAAALTQGTVVFTGPQSVVVGQAISGYVLWNNSGQTKSATLVLTTQHTLATLTAPAAAFTVGSGTSRTDFTISLNSGSPLGPASLQLKAVDPADPATTYGESQLVFTVVTPPGILAKYRWEIIGVLILLLLAVLAAYRRRHVRRVAADVRGLSVVLAGGSGLSAPLRAPSRGWADTFRFAIRNEDEPDHRRLDNPRRGEDTYTARRELEKRRRTGRIIVMSPQGQEYTPTIGGPAENLPSGASIAFRDVKMPKMPDVTGTPGSWSGPRDQAEGTSSGSRDRPEANGQATGPSPNPPPPGRPDDPSDARWM
jgi:hypothetical protein